MEYLGGLVPLLKGKRISMLRPEFVIFDPQVDGKYINTLFKFIINLFINQLYFIIIQSII
jgi:hypothetical protein